VDEEGALALATRDGVFFYTIQEGRTVAASVGGEKQAVIALGGGYLLILSEEEGQKGASFNRAPFASFGSMRQVVVQVVHVERKIVACSMSLPAPVRVAAASGSARGAACGAAASLVTLYAVDGSGTVHRISEKPIQGQVEALCDAKLFPQALRLCERALGDQPDQRDQRDLSARWVLNSTDRPADRPPERPTDRPTGRPIDLRLHAQTQPSLTLTRATRLVPSPG
jgi:hypothetical protein